MLEFETYIRCKFGFSIFSPMGLNKSIYQIPKFVHYDYLTRNSEEFNKIYCLLIQWDRISFFLSQSKKDLSSHLPYIYRVKG